MSFYDREERGVKCGADGTECDLVHMTSFHNRYFEAARKERKLDTSVGKALRPYRLPKDIQAHVREGIADECDSPEEAAKYALMAVGLKFDRDLTVMEHAVKYAIKVWPAVTAAVRAGSFRRERDRPGAEDGPALQLALKGLGSRARVRFVAMASPLVRRSREALWNHPEPLAHVDRLGEEAAYRELFRWLGESEAVDVTTARAADWFEAWHRLLSDLGNRISQSLAVPLTARCLRLKDAAMNLVATTSHGGSVPLLAEVPGGRGWLSLKAAVLWITLGIYPDLPLATGAVTSGDSDQWISTKVGQPDTTVPWSDEATNGLKAVTITVYDPDAVSPEKVQSLYRSLLESGGIRAHSGRPEEAAREVLGYLELELILEELGRQLAARSEAETIDPVAWRWEPTPTDLHRVWQERAEDFGLRPDRKKTYQGIALFQDRRDYEDYRPAIVGEVNSSLAPRSPTAL